MASGAVKTEWGLRRFSISVKHSSVNNLKSHTISAIVSYVQQAGEEFGFILLISCCQIKVKMPGIFFYPHNFTPQEEKFFMSIINDERSWGPKWSVVHTIDHADWSVSLESNIGPLSLTYMAVEPRHTAFNLNNWTFVPGPLKGLYSVKDYRTYVINHELGHVLGHDHYKGPSGPKGPLGPKAATAAPIMIQQTKGLKGFSKNVWPLNSEKKQEPTLGDYT